MRLPTKIWHLAMLSPDDLRPARPPAGPVTVARVDLPMGAYNRFFYSEIGRHHHWIDRLEWSADRWQTYVERPEIETWTITERGTPGGYAELWERPDGSGHVAMFGILPSMQGRGLGGHLLTAAVRRVWERGATLATVDTCELDGRHALPNYRARGFDVARTSVQSLGRLGA